jgi:hypothetical protein
MGPALRNIHRLGAVVAVGAVAHAPAQPSGPEPERPSAAQRVVRVFDFEESAYNPLPVPFGWIRAQNDPAVPRDRPGFPIWNGGILDYESPAWSGSGSAYLPARGGSASLRLLSGVIGVFPGADYGVRVRVRTENMVHARAALAARLLDQQGRVLARTEAVSEPIRSRGGWSELLVQVPGIDDRAAYLQIEMLVLQPRQQPGQDRTRPFRVWNEDYHAGAWFDDLTVTLLPRLEISTGHPGQAIPSDATPELTVLIRDLTGEHLNARVVVLDADGQVVDEAALAPGQGRMIERFTPSLPAPGWYRAALLVDGDNGRVGMSVLDFAWGAPEDEHAEPARSFAVRAPAVDSAGAAALPTMVAWSGVARAVVGVWDESLTRDTAVPGVNPAFEAVRTLLNDGVEVTAALDSAPRDLADLIGRDAWDVPGVLTGDEALWMPWSERMLDDFGQGVLSWQIGRESTGTDAARRAAEIDAVGSVVAKWVPGPELRSVWPIGVGVPAELVAPARGLVIRDDGAGDDDSLAALVSEWAVLARAADTDADPPTLTIEFPATRDGRLSRAVLGKLARRVITAWAAARRENVQATVRFALSEPWRSTGGLRPTMMPTPELAAWRTLASVLGPQDGAVRELDLLPGVRTLLTGSDDRGVLIAWLTDPDAPVTTLELPLNIGPVRRVDLLGERRTLEPTEDGSLGVSWHRVALSREPVIVEGVRADLLRFMAGVRLTPDRLEPVLDRQRAALTVSNPWAYPIRGRVFIVEPGGLSAGPEGRDRSWSVTPRVVPFALDAGQTLTEPVDVAFGAGQESGWIPAVFDVQLFADQEYPMLRVPRRMRIDSQDLALDVTAYRTDSGAVAVHAIVTNRSDESRSVDLAAVAAGAARERATINGLPESATAQRRFLIDNVEPGARISVGLTERTTGIRLTKTIDAP